MNDRAVAAINERKTGLSESVFYREGKSGPDLGFACSINNTNLSFGKAIQLRMRSHHQQMNGMFFFWLILPLDKGQSRPSRRMNQRNTRVQPSADHSSPEPSTIKITLVPDPTQPDLKRLSDVVRLI